MKRAEGSVTIYFCLSIVIVGGLLLSLLEVVRIEGLHGDAREWADFALVSLCGGYQKELFDIYEIFALDGGFGQENLSLEYGEAEMAALLQENLIYGEGLNLYRMQPHAVEITGYRLLTDNKGQAFVKYVAAMMQSELPGEAVKKLVQSLSKRTEKTENTVNLEEHMTNANQALEEARAEEATKTEEATGTEETENTKESEAATKDVSDPIEEIKQLLDQGIWSLAVPADTEISTKSITLNNTLEKRTLETGTMKNTSSVSGSERVLFQEYVKQTGGHFLSPGSKNALSYGMEYLLWGKESDEENLKAAVNQLLLIREGINYVYLQTDAAKQAEALSIATALAGTVPAVIPVVQQGVLAAWAYAESVCEVRALLRGKKVPLIKSAANWQVSLSNIAGDAMAEYTKDSSGLDYEGYLEILLYTKSSKTVAYRMLDIIENTLFLKADRLITELTIYTEYEAKGVFSGIFMENGIGKYRFVCKSDYAYQ